MGLVIYISFGILILAIIVFLLASSGKVSTLLHNATRKGFPKEPKEENSNLPSVTVISPTTEGKNT